MSKIIQPAPALNPPEPIGIQIAGPLQAKAASKAATEYCATLGFSELESEEIGLAVSELASNLAKHGGGGHLRLIALFQEGRRGVQIVSQNNNHVSPDLERALTDGFTTAGGLGTGLGAVNRFMDSIEFQPSARSGFRIVCRRWVRPATSGRRERPLEFAVATRSCGHAAENGDAFVVQQWDGHALAAVIDGLGHGPYAQRAALAARQYLEHHFDQPLEALFRGVERACRATRGVVMGLARFDLGCQRVQLAGIGNIEVRLLGGSAPFKFVVRRGVLGMGSAPRPIVTDNAWTSDGLLFMHSDGIQSKWALQELKHVSSGNPVLMAKHLLDRYGSVSDDATVLVVRNRARQAGAQEIIHSRAA